MESEASDLQPSEGEEKPAHASQHRRLGSPSMETETVMSQSRKRKGTSPPSEM